MVRAVQLDMYWWHERGELRVESGERAGGHHQSMEKRVWWNEAQASRTDAKEGGDA